MFYVYALYIRSFDKIYIGYTSNLRSRFQSHNELATKGYTVRYRPWTILYTETLLTKREALKRESELKSARGRAFIWELVKKLNDDTQSSGG